MPCIPYSASFIRSQILLTFNRLQVMYSVFSIALEVEVAYKGLFLIQQHSKVQGQALVYNLPKHYFGSMLHFKLYNYNFYSVLLNQSTLLLLQ